MAENFTIARPYAKAVFETAESNGSLQEWRQVVEVLAQIARDPDVAHIIEDPKLTQQQMTKLFCDAVLHFVPSLSQTIQKELHNFILLLGVNKRLHVLPAISEQYQHLLEEHENRMRVHITSAFPLDESQQKQLKEKLKNKLQAQINLEFNLEPKLIGGLIIRADNWVFDGSVSGQLDRLRENFQ